MSARRFVWYELLTPDTAAATAFYGKVFGWGTAPFGDEGYAMWTNAEVPFGGLMKTPDGTPGPPAWTGYIGVANVDEAAAAVAGSGGVIHFPPTDIPGAGRFAVVADPQGAVFAVHHSDHEPGAPAAPGPGSVCWHELITSDPAAAQAWYSQHFGWTAAGEHDMGGMIYRMFGVGDPMPAGGIFQRPPETPVSAWLFYFESADLDASLEVVKANGGNLCFGPMDVPGGGRIAQCIDPQGAMFALHQSPAAS